MTLPDQMSRQATHTLQLSPSEPTMLAGHLVNLMTRHEPGQNGQRVGACLFQLAESYQAS